ncbi:MAG: transporter substrate-binding domain-containing protein [Thermodesulfobacteriota bacterium]
MKKLTLSVALAVSMFAASAMAADTVKIATEGAYAPYNYVDDSGKVAGYEIELGNALCKEAGLTCEWVVNEWDSIIPNLIAGNYDAIMAGMSVTDERKKTINFSDEYYPVAPSMYAAAAGKKMDLSALKGKKIGVQGATVQAAYAEKNFGADNTILSFETFDQSVADLMAGNIDILLSDGDPIIPVVKASKGALEFVGDGVRIGGGIAIGLRQKDAELSTKLNTALAALKGNGTVDTLIKKYFENGPFYSN